MLYKELLLTHIIYYIIKVGLRHWVTPSDFTILQKIFKNFKKKKFI